MEARSSPCRNRAYVRRCVSGYTLQKQIAVARRYYCLDCVTLYMRARRQGESSGPGQSAPTRMQVAEEDE